MISSSRLPRTRAISTTADGHAPAPAIQPLSTQAEHPLHADLRIDGDEAVVRVAGEVDLATAPGLTTLLETARCRPGISTLLLDLSGVDFIDAAGVAALLHARRRCTNHRVTLRVRGIGPNVRRVLILTATDRHLGLSDGDGSRC